MAFQQKPNTGSLFKNHKKNKETHPDYTGSCLVNGVELKIGAWLKTSKKGEKFFSMSFQVPQGNAPQANGYHKPIPKQSGSFTPPNDGGWGPEDGGETPF